MDRASMSGPVENITKECGNKVIKKVTGFGKGSMEIHI
jgi:hypothetical protein